MPKGWIDRLHYLYLGYLCLWPGLAVLGLQFVPATGELWVAKLPGALLFIGCLVLLAAVAIYLSFITEVLPFPDKLPLALATTFLLPFYIVVAALTTHQSFWEAIVSGYLVECGIVLITILFLVTKKIFQLQWDTFAVVVLVGTSGLMLSAMVPLFWRLMEHNWWSYLLAIGTVLTGTIQNTIYYEAPARPNIPAEMFIVIGVFALIALPFAGALIRGL